MGELEARFGIATSQRVVVRKGTIYNLAEGQAAMNRDKNHPKDRQVPQHKQRTTKIKKIRRALNRHLRAATGE